MYRSILAICVIFAFALSTGLANNAPEKTASYYWGVHRPGERKLGTYGEPYTYRNNGDRKGSFKYYQPGTSINRVELKVKQNGDGRADIVWGGIGQDHIQINFEAYNSAEMIWSAVIYGR